MNTTIFADTQAKPVSDGAQPGRNDSQTAANDPALREGGPPPSPAFPRLPGETPRAFSAFMTYCDDDVRRMTLAQVSRALGISSAVARSAITGTELPASSETGFSPLQQQLLAGVTRIYGPAPTPAPAASSPAPVAAPELQGAKGK